MCFSVREILNRIIYKSAKAKTDPFFPSTGSISSQAVFIICELATDLKLRKTISDYQLAVDCDLAEEKESINPLLLEAIYNMTKCLSPYRDGGMKMSDRDAYIRNLSFIYCNRDRIFPTSITPPAETLGLPRTPQASDRLKTPVKATFKDCSDESKATAPTTTLPAEPDLHKLKGDTDAKRHHTFLEREIQRDQVRQGVSRA